MMKSRLPIGIQHFRKIRENGLHYVDKTPWIHRLVDEGECYFLSRPRRFGKSLLVDTMKELFEGSKGLFEGTHIHDKWDWSTAYPVVRLSFDRNFKQPGRLHTNFMAQMDAVERRTGLTSSYASGSERFAHLLELLHETRKQPVAVLVDEYDKPILDALATPELARDNRDYLQDVYAVIKGSGDHIRFSFLTGVSKFSKVNLFSGVNNLKDITLDPRYAAICGYRERDLDEVFAGEIESLDRDRIKDWYNGYGWGGEPDETVYNPFDVLLLLDSRKFKNHWFQTGSPTFLVEMLKRRPVVPLDLERMVGSEELLSKFDIDDISLEALLFQTGYLTVKEVTERPSGSSYHLGYPNREVRQSLNRLLLPVMGADATWERDHADRLYTLLDGADFEGLEEQFRSLLGRIPYEWHTNNQIARYEGWYASLFYCWFAAVGLDPTGEPSTSFGRPDMAVEHRGHVYLFEFKVVADQPTGKAMAQMIDRRYADAYRGHGRTVHLIAVEFSRKARNIADFQAKTVRKDEVDATDHGRALHAGKG